MPPATCFTLIAVFGSRPCAVGARAPRLFTCRLFQRMVALCPEGRSYSGKRWPGDIQVCRFEPVRSGIGSFSLSPVDATPVGEPTSVRGGLYNLAPGSYRFRVVASNPDGAWNGAEAAIAFEVDPLWWQTWWLRTGVVMACVGAIVAYFHFRMQRLTSRLNLRFDERLAERTRIARDLHDTLLQSFHGLMFRYQAARNMLPRRPEEAMEVLDGALERTEQAITEGRDAIHNLRASTTVTNELAQAVTALGNEMSQEMGHA